MMTDTWWAICLLVAIVFDWVGWGLAIYWMGRARAAEARLSIPGRGRR